MIATYHGKIDCSAAEILAVPTPLCLRPLRGFGGMTARPAAQKIPPCHSRQCLCDDHGG
jgi:hypothetical protein